MSTFISILREACLKAASPETSYDPELYKTESKKSPLYGHCSAVANTVKVTFGGEIVTGRVQNITHYWNRLPDGTEIDLTSCQFGGDGYTPFKKGRKVSYKKVHPRFVLFMMRVREKLGSTLEDNMPLEITDGPCSGPADKDTDYIVLTRHDVKVILKAVERLHSMAHANLGKHAVVDKPYQTIKGILENK